MHGQPGGEPGAAAWLPLMCINTARSGQCCRTVDASNGQARSCVAAGQGLHGIVMAGCMLGCTLMLEQGQRGE